MKKDYHVVKAADKWVVKREEEKYPVEMKYFNTQKEAYDFAVPFAENDEAEVIIHDANGKIRNPNSFGKDPKDIIDTKP